MKFKELRIKKFRGINDLKIDDFQQVNLIVGKNNSGKTSILEALFLLTGISNVELQRNINIFRNYVKLNDQNDLGLIFYNLNFDNEITLNANFDIERVERNLSINPIFKLEDYLNKEPIHKNYSNNINDNVSTLQKDVEGVEFNFSIKQKNTRKEKFKSKFLLKGSNSVEIKLDPHYKEELRGIYLNPTLSNYNDLSSRIEKLLVAKKKNKLINILRQIEPNIISIELGTGGIVYVDTGLDRLLPINIMGDGIRRMLYIIASISDAANGMVFIDEIENGFYYSIQEDLWHLIFEAAYEYNVQVFATTHSEECVKAFKNVYGNHITLFTNDSLRLYRIEKQDDIMKAIKFDYEMLNAAVEQDWEVR